MPALAASAAPSLRLARPGWALAKKQGKPAVPPGDATVAFEKLDVALRAIGLFVVPVGELEGFDRNVPGHGPDWVNGVLEKYADLSTESALADAQAFIGALVDL